uniref:Uncharacterized protein n=1 Tax=Rangifer tarandus platyrhynchus TaxID=3082113 RepID=A0ACB0END9_RANTA|nr:unnamed protein product [Rangifer tarandus platyrhynchus]
MRHSLASISRGFGGGGGGDRSINSSRWDGASREEGRQRGPGQKTHWGAALTTSSASSLFLSPREGWGGGETSARAPAVPGPRPALPFSPAGEEKEASENRTPGWRRPRGQPLPLCARSRWGRGRGCCGPGALSLCAPGRPKSDAPLRAAPAAAAAAAAAAAPAAAAKRGLGSAQLLIIPAQISLRRKHSVGSRTHSAPLALTRLERTAISVAFRYPEPQV